MAAVIAALLSSLLMLPGFSQVNALSLNYYEQTCPDAEQIISNAVKKAMGKDQRVPAALLRMHFHDCFIRVRKQTNGSIAKWFIVLIVLV